jgi:heat shock protein HslJ
MKSLNQCFILIFLLMLLTNCSNTKKQTAVTGGSELLYANQWNLTELNSTPVTSGMARLLFFPGQVSRVSGNAGCNNLTGTFELTGVNFIHFSPLVTTRMGCIEATREQEFTEALGQVNNWSIVNNQLLLNNGKILLARLTAAPVKPTNLVQ